VCADPECEVHGKPNHRAEQEAAAGQRDEEWKRQQHKAQQKSAHQQQRRAGYAGERFGSRFAPDSEGHAVAAVGDRDHPAEIFDYTATENVPGQKYFWKTIVVRLELWPSGGGRSRRIVRRKIADK